MRSIILSTLDYPPNTGGVASYLANLAACFPRGSVHVLAPEGKDTHDADMRSEVPIYRRQMLARWLRPRWIAALYWTWWLARKEQASLLIVSHVLPMGVIARMLKRWRKLPYVVIVHGMDLALALEKGGAKRARAAAVLADAELVVANSVFTARLAESAGVPKEKLMVVRPSTSFPPSTAVAPSDVDALRARLGIGRNFTLLTLGRLVARKGFAEAVEATALLAAKGHDVTLVVAGDGPERARLEKLAKDRGIEARVKFAGRVADADLPALYAAADVFVMAPRSVGADVEGFGIVYLEANLMGKPVVASRAGGVPDAVVDGETGLLVAPGDPKAIADAVEKLTEDPALAERLGQRGRRRVLDEFGWKRQAAPLVGALMKE